ncbi:MAG: hypothetical protein COA45_06400 [Zetaproteobacteria bacterium]|nr:MAG: hypothetical protein COA45_06400 [Zetaproteobacteria bacterium]
MSARYTAIGLKVIKKMTIKNHENILGAGGLSHEEQYNNAAKYLGGIGVEKNYPMAVRLLQDLADSAYMPAQNAMANIFEKGKFGVEKDMLAAVDLYADLARQDYKGARERLERLVDKNVASAFLGVGALYQDGDGPYEQSDLFADKFTKKGMAIYCKSILSQDENSSSALSELIALSDDGGERARDELINIRQEADFIINSDAFLLHGSLKTEFDQDNVQRDEDLKNVRARISGFLGDQKSIADLTESKFFGKIDLVNDL